MNVTGIPTAPVSAGQTVCVTVTGAVGPVKAGEDGSAVVQSVTQSSTRPNEWTVCFTVGLGLGTVVVTDGKAARTVAIRGR